MRQQKVTARRRLRKNRVLTADPMLAAQVRRAHARLVLLQDANDLRFAETASLHRLSPQLENRLTSKRGLFRGAGQHAHHLSKDEQHRPAGMARRCPQTPTRPARFSSP